jgi:uncharacterized protein YsxB (DUF464 family)
MATGRGDFPFQSGWFGPNRNPSRARFLLRTSVSFNPVVETAFGDFFYPLGPPPQPTIQFIGAGWITTFTGGTSINLNALNTGPRPGPLLENDIVIAIHQCRIDSNVDVGVSTAGYTEISDIFSDGSTTNDTNLSVSWKRMGATPDTTVTKLSPGGREVFIAYVFRGVDTTNPFDVTATTATGSGSGIPNNPSITPITNNSVVVAIGAGINAALTGATPPASFSESISILDIAVSARPLLSVAMRRWRTGDGAIDPAAWGNITDDAGYAWAAVTLALRPQSALTQYSLVADTIAFAINATAANLERGREVLAGSTAFTVTGQAANLERGYEVLALGTTYTISSSAANLEFNREVVAEGASYLINGTDATLIPGTVLTLIADPTSFTLTGSAANLELGREVFAAAASFTVSATAANLEFNREVFALGGSFAITGQAAALERGSEVLALGTTYTITGQAATLRRGRNIILSGASFTLSGSAAFLEKTINLSVSPASYSIGLSPIFIYILEPKNDDVTALYSRGRGKKRFWNEVRAWERKARNRGDWYG